MLKKNLTVALFTGILILLLHFGAENVYACLCPSTSVKTRVKLMKKEADAIFTGTVKSVANVTANSFKVVLSVKNSWKGESPREYTIYVSGGCKVGFIEGKDYLVYAKKDRDDFLVTEICWGTGNLTFAKNDLKVLGKPQRKQDR